MYDALNILQTTVTSVTSYTSTGFDLKATPIRGMVARFIVTSYISEATAGSVWTPKIQGSSDNTTFIDLSIGTPLTGGTAAGIAEIFVPFSTDYRYIRPVFTLSSSAGTPSVVFLCDLGTAKKA